MIVDHYDSISFVCKTQPILETTLTFWYMVCASAQLVNKQNVKIHGYGEAEEIQMSSSLAH